MTQEDLEQVMKEIEKRENLKMVEDLKKDIERRKELERKCLERINEFKRKQDEYIDNWCIAVDKTIEMHIKEFPLIEIHYNSYSDKNKNLPNYAEFDLLYNSHPFNIFGCAPILIRRPHKKEEQVDTIWNKITEHNEKVQTKYKECEEIKNRISDKKYKLHLAEMEPICVIAITLLLLSFIFRFEYETPRGLKIKKIKSEIESLTLLLN